MSIVIMFDTAMKQDSQVVLGGFVGGGGGSLPYGLGAEPIM